MNYIKVKDKENLVRDINSNGVVNINEESYRNYIEAYKKQLNSNKKIETLQSEVNEIKSNVEEIKSMLNLLMENIVK